MAQATNSSSALKQAENKAQQRLSPDTRKAMVSQFLGFGLDAYDMAMVVVMAPILAKLFVSPGGSVAWQYTKVLLLYSITMAARPVGSAFFGHYADKIGRRWLLIFTIAGVGFMSLLAGFLPTYKSVGGLAYLLFAVLRLFMGIFFGGEYAVGHTFAIEHAPQIETWRDWRICAVRVPAGIRSCLVGLRCHLADCRRGRSCSNGVGALPL